MRNAVHMFVTMLVAVAAATAQPVLTKIIPSETVTLRDPSAVSVAPDGKLIISDTGHHRVLAVDGSGKLLFEVGSMGSDVGEFLWPKDVAAESGIACWVADYGNRRICKLSRQFEMKGCYSVTDAESDREERVERLAVTPQGDVYLYAEDSGRLLRFDPLFVFQGSLGSTRGESFLPAIRQLVYVKGQGIIWHARGDAALSYSDPLLTRIETYPVSLQNPDEFVLASSGTKLYAAGLRGIYLLDPESGNALEVVSEEALKQAGIKHINDAAIASDGTIYLLEARSGSVYSIAAQSR